MDTIHTVAVYGGVPVLWAIAYAISQWAGSRWPSKGED